MSTNTIPGSLNRAPFQANNPQELLEALARVYQEFGLNEGDARRAAAADLGADLGHVALAA